MPRKAIRIEISVKTDGSGRGGQHTVHVVKMEFETLTRNIVMTRIHEEDASSFTYWTEACHMPYRRNNWTNSWNVGQDGLVVMRWDF